MFYARWDRDKFFVKLLKKVPELDFRRLGDLVTYFCVVTKATLRVIIT